MSRLLFILLFSLTVVFGADSRAYLVQSSNNAGIAVFNTSLQESYGFGVNAGLISPMLLSPDDSTGYVFSQASNPGSGSVMFEEIDLATRQVIRTLPIPGNVLSPPNCINGCSIPGEALSPDGTALYADGYSIATATGVLLKVDLVQNSVSVLLTTTQFEPLCISVSSDGTRLYLAQEQLYSPFNSSILELSTSSFAVLHAFPLTGFPEFLTISPDGLTAYISYDSTHIGAETSTEVMSLQTGSIEATFPSASPAPIALSPDGSSAYLQMSSASGTTCGDFCLIQVSTADFSIVNTLPLGIAGSFGALAISPDGNYLALGNGPSLSGNPGETLMVSLTDLSVVAQGPVGTSGSITFAHGSDTLFLETAGVVAAVDSASGEKLAEFSAGLSPQAVLVSPRGSVLYASDLYSMVTCLSAASGAVLAQIQLPRPTSGNLDSSIAGPLAFSPNGSVLYVGTVQGIAEVNTATNQYTKELAPSLTDSSSLAVSTNGAVLYATSRYNLYALNTATGAQVLSFDGKSQSPEVSSLNSIVVSPDGQSIFVVGFSLANRIIYQLSTKNFSILQQASLVGSGSVLGAALDASGSTLYVAAGNVFAFNVASGAITTIPTSGSDSAIALTANGKQAVASSSSTLGNVDVIDLQTLTAGSPISIGGESIAVTAH